jgi:hypothetical protein
MIGNAVLCFVISSCVTYRKRMQAAFPTTKQQKADAETANTEVTIKDEPTEATGALEDGKDVPRKGRKRKLPTATDDISPPSTVDKAAKAAEVEVILQGAREDVFSPSKSRRTSSHTAHYKGSDILISLMADIANVKQEMLSVDEILTQLSFQELSASSKKSIPSPSKLMKLLWSRSDIAHNEDDTPLAVNELEQISRTVVKVPFLHCILLFLVDGLPLTLPLLRYRFPTSICGCIKVDWIITINSGWCWHARARTNSVVDGKA